MSDNNDTAIEINPELQMKISSLEEAILKAHPTMPILLKEIHTILKNDPTNVTLLSESDIAVIVSGLKQQTKTEITASTMKKKSAALKNVSLADL
jgi:hypothetical protein